MKIRIKNSSVTFQKFNLVTFSETDLVYNGRIDNGNWDLAAPQYSREIKVIPFNADSGQIYAAKGDTNDCAIYMLGEPYTPVDGSSAHVLQYKNITTNITLTVSPGTKYLAMVTKIGSGTVVTPSILTYNGINLL